MTRGDAPISSYLTARESLLRAAWQTSVEDFAERLGRFLMNPRLYDEVKGLMLDLLAVVERPEGAAGLDPDLFHRIVADLRAIQERERVGTTELVFFLFAVKDILDETLRREAAKSSPEPGTETLRSGLGQVSVLLNRLGLVLFESDVRARESTDLSHDVLAMEYALLYERARRLAITDQLTGLFNFGYFRERLREERARAERHSRLLSLIIFDIDWFKQYNDTQGHPAGNEVLRGIARVLQARSRNGDIVARYGGEELVILLPEATRRDATALAERIRAEVAATPFPHAEKQPGGTLTLSAGVATFPVDANDDAELIERADQSLYQAKRAGRNRVVSYEPPHRERIVYRPYRPVTRVALVGSFNNWDPEYDFMTPTGDGAYEFVISLNPGVYQYKFVLDGAEWIPDPARSERCADGLGGDNSVLHVLDPARVTAA